MLCVVTVVVVVAVVVGVVVEEEKNAKVRRTANRAEVSLAMQKVDFGSLPFLL